MKFCTPLVFALLVLAAPPALAAPSLPGGASSLNEVHGDWAVGCAIQGQGDGAKLLCAASQRQVNKTNQQQVLAIELTPSADAAKGVLALPLGLDLAKGAVLQVDEGNSTPLQAFSTCVAGGCLVPLNFDAANLKFLRAGKALNVYATTMGAKPIKFAISLKGLPAALDRVTALLQAK